MSMTDRAARGRRGELDAFLVSSPVTLPLVVLQERAAAPAGATACGERLPRDLLLRLAGLFRQVGAIRQGHATDPDLSLRLDDVAAGLEALIQSIYDETALHLAGRRG